MRGIGSDWLEVGGRTVFFPGLMVLVQIVLKYGERLKKDSFLKHLSRFQRYIGIDYSGAKTSQSGLPGLRVYVAVGSSRPVEVYPSDGSSKYWSRRGIATWLADRFVEMPRTIVGIDHGFSFPLLYFQKYRLKHDWHAFLADFCDHWPTDQAGVSVQLVRENACGNGSLRCGESRWRRLVDREAKAKSVFHFDVPGSVAKSTHAGLPWLRFLREQCSPNLHFWPFDGWQVPHSKHVIAEMYPALWNKEFPKEDRTQDQHDAFVIATWLQKTDREGLLPDFFEKPNDPRVATIAKLEGWILGMVGNDSSDPI